MKKIIIVLAILLLISVGYFLIFYQFETFYIKGYRGLELEYIKTLDTNTQALFKKYPVVKNVQQLLNDQRFKKENLKDYIELLNRHQDRFDDVIEAVNLKMNLQEYVKYKANIFKDDPYYLAFNDLRYQKAYPKFKNQVDAVRKTVEFVNTKADLKVYEDVFQADISQDYLVLVNKYYYLEEDYVPNDLVSFKKGMGNGYIREATFKAFEKMHNDALKKGYQLISISPFRTYNSQYSLYNSYVASDGVTNADRYSARPGFSEHQTGLVIDISIPGYSIEAFGKSDAYLWMQENAYKYGFIERYPLNKESVTGYIHEPWHYRFVGEQAAKKIQESKLTFDEYYEYYVVGGKKDV